MANIIVEDFTNTVRNANSYVSVEQAREFLNNRDVESDDEDISRFLLKAMDFIESFEGRFKGSRLDSTQPLAFPRVVGWNGSVPRLLATNNLIRAVLHCVEILASGSDLLPLKLNREDFVTKKKLDVLEKQYSDKWASSFGALSNFPLIENYLSVYFNSTINPDVGR